MNINTWTIFGIINVKMHHKNSFIAFQFNSIQFIQKQSRSTKVLVCHKKPRKNIEIQKFTIIIQDFVTYLQTFK